MAASAITAWAAPAVTLRPRWSAAHRPATSPPRPRMPAAITIAAVSSLGSPSTLSA
jgi:hypothetical protein